MTRDSIAVAASAPVQPGAEAAMLRILVVDDSEAIRRFMKARIEALAPGIHAVTVETATSGEEAVQMCANGAFDLVFLDVVMPGIGGLEACRRIKAGSATRIAMLSSLKTPQDHAAARTMGCDNYLAKPPEDLGIRSLLRIVAMRKLTATPL